ncbi:ankyrin repeat-containing domain protein [Xylaria arbuscula]|nr:ankyrin repeat-containing domain protein [Xylaria arbuscula]
MSTLSPAVTDLWSVARSRLTPEYQSHLTNNVVDDTSQSPLQTLLLLVQEKQRKSTEKRWKLAKPSGEVIFLRDLFEKITRWINKFKEIGDTIVTYDPTHAALPWAGVRFLLHLAISDVELFGSVVEGVEIVSRIITRCGYYEAVYLAQIGEHTTDSEKLLKDTIIRLYVSILEYLAKSADYFKAGMGKRILGSLGGSPTKFEAELNTIQQIEDELQSIVRLVEGKQLSYISNMVGFINLSSVETKVTVESIKQIMESLEQPVTRMIGHLARFEESKEQQEWSQLSKWLGNANFRNLHDMIHRDLLPGTGDWIFNRSEYQQWQYSSSSSVLWLHGITGCGKSKLCSLVVHNSLRRMDDIGDNAAPIAYFYCAKTANKELLSSEVILNSILKQLSRSKTGDRIHHAVLQEYQRRKQDANRDGIDPLPLTLEECGDLIVSVASDYPIQIFLDGVDELDDARELLGVLNRIVADSSNVVKVFLSSRDVTDVALWLKHVVSLTVTSSDNSTDIANFVMRSVDNAIETKKLLKGKVSPELKQHIISRLSNGARSMFLWASLHLTQLCDPKRYKLEQDVVSALEDLPVSLKETFNQIYQKINEYSGQARHVTKGIFVWLLAAQRPLSKQELIDIINSCMDKDEDNFYTSTRFELNLTEGDILDLCSSFLAHEPSSQHFSFAHASILEYLQSLPEYSDCNINYTAAQCCLTRLLQVDDNPDPFDQVDLTVDPASIVDAGISPSDATKNEYVSQGLSFRRYAACYWARHYTMARNHAKIMHLNETLLKFAFGDEGSRFELWLEDVQALIESNSVNSISLVKQLAATGSDDKSPIFVACIYGILPILDRLSQIKNAVNWTAKNSRDVSAIYLTARFGQLAATKYLLGKGADVNSEGGVFGNPTQAAAFNGHVDVLEVLASNGANLRASGRFTDTFHAALMGNQNGAMKLLLQEPWVNEITTDTGDLLCRAAYYGHHEVTETLLQRIEGLRKCAAPSPSNTTVALKTDESESPFPHDTLQAALYSGRSGATVAMRLLKRLGDVNSEGGRFGNALQAACAGGYSPAVRWLLEHGANANSKGRYGSALKAACLGGHNDVVNILLEAGAKSGPSPGFDAFEAAASQNRLSTLVLLMDQAQKMMDHVDINSLRPKNPVQNPLSSALESACLRGHVDIARYLLDNGARSVAALALEGAFISGHEEIISMLLVTLEEIPDYTRHEVVSCSVGDVLKLMPRTELEYEEEEEEVEVEAHLGSPSIEAGHEEEAGFLDTRFYGTLEEPPEKRNRDISDLDSNFPQGRTYTWRLAASRGSRAAFEILLTKGMPLDGGSHPTLIEIAALHGNIEIVALLLDRNATVGCALQCAVKNGREDIIQLLLSRQPQLAIDTRIDMPDLLDNYEYQNYKSWPRESQATDSPLALAFVWKREHIVEMLLEHSRLTGWPEPSRALVLQVLKGDKLSVRRILTEMYGQTISSGGLGLETNALHAMRVATKQGHIEVVAMILELITPAPDIRFSYMKEMAHVALGNNRRKPNRDRLLAVVDEMALPDQREQIAGIKFQLAVRYGHTRTREDLDKHMLGIRSSSDVLLVYLRKAFQDAIERFDLKTAGLLLEHPFSVHFVRTTPDILHRTMNAKSPHRRYRSSHGDEFRNYQEILHTLIKLGADVEARDKDMWPPIYYACVYGLGETFQVLIEHGVTIYIADYVTSREDIHKDEAQDQPRIGEGNEHRHKSYNDINLLELTLDNINLREGAEGVCDTWGSIVFKLLETGVRLDPSCESMGSLLYAISESGNVGQLEKLFQYGVDPNLPTKDSESGEKFGSAIHIAVDSAQVEIVESLIRHRADLSIKRPFPKTLSKGALSVTPVQGALKQRREKSEWDKFWRIFELLIEAGIGEEDCQSILRVASEQGNIPLATKLLGRGTRLTEMPMTQSLSIIKLLVAHGTEIDSPANKARWLQADATRRGLCDLLEYLIAGTGQLLSATRLIQEAFGRCSRKPLDEQKRILDFLLQKGYVSLNERSRCYCGKSWTNPLQALIANGHYELVKYVLAKGADPQCPGCSDTAITVLFKHAGVYWKKKEVVLVAEQLLEHGANIDGMKDAQEDHDMPSETPLLFALARSDWDMVEFLVNRGADVNAGVISPLTFAFWMRSGRSEVVQLLKSKDAVAKPVGQVNVMVLHTELRNGMPWLSYQYQRNCRWGGMDHC